MLVTLGFLIKLGLIPTCKHLQPCWVSHHSQWDKSNDCNCDRKRPSEGHAVHFSADARLPLH